MSRPLRTTAWLLSALVVFGLARDARAQGWAIDLSAGRTVYDPVAVDVGADNLTGTVRYHAPGEKRDAWVYGAAAAPFGGQDPFWGAIGAGGRFLALQSPSRRLSAGVDVGMQGFLFRDRVTDQIGRGGTVDALPFARVSSDTAYVELRGGWRGHSLSYLTGVQNRGLLETGLRAAYGSRFSVEGDGRFVVAEEGTYPQLSSGLAYNGSRLRIWTRVSKWLADDLTDVGWGAGTTFALGDRTHLFASVREESPDPLYWNPARRSWSVGITQFLGRRRPALAVATVVAAGRVHVRVPVSDAPATDVSIAGSFNDWQPLPMHREGDSWVVELTLPPGVYDYAFRSGDGRWFVPATTAGRRSDGMGGYVARLVVA